MAKQSADRQLGILPIPRLIVKLAIPSIVAQLINVLYNIIDRVFIGSIPQIGTMALTGVGVAFPVITLISAFAAFAGQGSAALASIQLGTGNCENAERILGNACSLVLCLAVALTLGFTVFSRPVLFAFGASEHTIEYADSYLRIYLLGTVFVQITLGLNMFIGAQGRPAVAMLSVLAGAVVHLALDPLLIFTFHMGVRGAAWSTVISQGVSAAWTLRFLLGNQTSMRIRKENLRFDKKTIGSICAMGIPPFVMQSTDSLVSVVMNTGLLQYGGDLYIGAYTIMQSVMQMLVLPVSGLTQGSQAIISYNYGAGRYARARSAYQWMLGASLALTCFGCAAAMLFPVALASIFTPDTAMQALVGKTMPIFFAGVWAFGAQAASQTAFMGLGQVKISLLLSMLRKVFLLIPLAYFLPTLTHEVNAIFWATPISDVVASAITLALFIKNMKRLLPTALEGSPASPPLAHIGRQPRAHTPSSQGR